MSRLDELIQELCPDGVESVKIGQIAREETKRNKGQICKLAYSITKNGLVKTSDFFKDAKVTSEDTSAYKIVKKNWFVYSPSRIDVGSINYLRDQEQVIVSPMNVVFSVDETLVLPSYLLLYLQSRRGSWAILQRREGIEGMGRKLLPFDSFAKILVPLPPLIIQREIVRTLALFTEHLGELTAELTARKKQYEYYRDAVLAFDSSVPRVELGSTAKVTKLAGFEFTNYVKYSSSGKIIALRGLNVKEGRIVLDDVKYIDNSDLSKLERSKLVIGDMLFTYVGTVGQVALIDENDKYYLAPNVALIRADNSLVNPKYLMYYFQSTEFKRMQIDRLLQSSSMKNIPMEKIRKFMIPVPSLEIQNEIVNLLERFDTLCNDISSGLPAEIEARQKQYEYYRDKLLSFKELGA
jgi:type I restriction enzyme S subunit